MDEKTFVADTDIIKMEEVEDVEPQQIRIPDKSKCDPGSDAACEEAID